jgi:preprotein translocase subunit SecY
MQSAKHVRGRRVYGGTRQFLPLRVNQGGVMPIIFASSLLMIPAIIFGAFAQISDPDGMAGVWNTLSAVFSPGTGFMYNAFYIGMIFFFCYSGLRSLLIQKRWLKTSKSTEVLFLVTDREDTHQITWKK